jgi:hypothetical protein
MTELLKRVNEDMKQAEEVPASRLSGKINRSVSPNSRAAGNSSHASQGTQKNGQNLLSKL